MEKQLVTSEEIVKNQAVFAKDWIKKHGDLSPVVLYSVAGYVTLVSCPDRYAIRAAIDCAATLQADWTCVVWRAWMTTEHDLGSISAQNQGGAYVYGDVKKCPCKKEILFIQAKTKSEAVARRAYEIIRGETGIEFDPIPVDYFTGYLSL